MDNLSSDCLRIDRHDNGSSWPSECLSSGAYAVEALLMLLGQ